ncbi:hypothetical protein OG948_48585 (plasmid) [Embleya sp. NBC_00888]|uniref:hypothetical protein n=1 Tax=Embleya sp. NBC_00888 TaxID=2975960 RepID=UPI002F90C8F3|nr:hypothetical protein OG948_48585 [Embleya sp. NBC_00888]
MRRPVTGEVHVDYNRIYVESDPDGAKPDLNEAFPGQSEGLCGAAVPGVLFLATGLHKGNVGFTVEIHDEAPALDPVWEDVVEVSFRPTSEHTRLVQMAGEAAWDLDLPRTDHRVRYCARGMDEGQELSTRAAKEPQADSYLLQFWPAPPGPDRVIRQTSQSAAYRHRYASALGLPYTPEQRAEAERDRQAKERAAQERFAEEWLAQERAAYELAAQERAAEERAARARATEERRLHYERWEWGGRLPSETLRGVRRSNVLGLLTYDSELVHALDAAGPEVQRAVALLSAHRACEEAGLIDVPWVARALVELVEGRPLPSPFDDADLMRETLRSDLPVSKRSVLGAMPPERPPYCPPIDPAQVSLVTVQVATPYVPGPISQPHFALPAVLAAADPVPLRAALDAVWHALHTYGEHYPELLAEIRAACTEQAPK